MKNRNELSVVLVHGRRRKALGKESVSPNPTCSGFLTTFKFPRPEIIPSDRSFPCPSKGQKLLPGGSGTDGSKSKTHFSNSESRSQTRKEQVSGLPRSLVHH